MDRNYREAIEYFKVENISGYIKPGKSVPLRAKDMALEGLGLIPISYTDKGSPQADAIVIRALAGKDPVNG